MEAPDNQLLDIEFVPLHVINIDLDPTSVCMRGHSQAASVNGYIHSYNSIIHSHQDAVSWSATECDIP